MASRSLLLPSLMLIAVLFCGGVCLAMMTSREYGTWPDTWPKELEPYRDQAKTLYFATGSNNSTVYEIPFGNRDDFESVWPHILGLKSKGAPLILVSSPFAYGYGTMKLGVRILSWPERGLYTLKDVATGTWVADRQRASYVPAHKDIMLVCDGKVIDLNRIPLPPDTPIIDRRWEESPYPLPY